MVGVNSVCCLIRVGFCCEVLRFCQYKITIIIRDYLKIPMKVKQTSPYNNTHCQQICYSPRMY